jgi:uncharacterized DUF497 family protein
MHNIPRDFEWDERKRRSNIVKHGVDFDDVEEIFADPHGCDAISKGEHDEPRYVRIGALRGFIVTVVYTRRGDSLRIISARIASRQERARYGGQTR